MSTGDKAINFVSRPPGPALGVNDAGAREAWATMEQILLVIDDFINDVNRLDRHTLELCAHGGVAEHESVQRENVKTAPRYNTTTPK